MSLRNRILMALAAALAVATGMWLYGQWLAWFGQEILVPIAAGNRGNPGQNVIAHYPDARLHLETSHTFATSGKQEVPRIEVRSIGVVLDDSVDASRQSSNLRTRVVYLQMKPDETPARQISGVWKPVSVSLTPVPGAFNLQASVRSVDGAGNIDVSYAPDQLPLQRLPADNQHMAGILKVLPSGRAALVGLIAGNQRIQF